MEVYLVAKNAKNPEDALKEAAARMKQHKYQQQHQILVGGRGILVPNPVKYNYLINKDWNGREEGGGNILQEKDKCAILNIYKIVIISKRISYC